MKTCWQFLILLTFFGQQLFSQGTIRGKVTDESGESLIGVVVSLKLNKTIGVLTDLDGNYSLKLKDSAAQTIVFTYVSYKTIERNIKPTKKGDVIVMDVTLKSADNELQEVEVVAKQVKANEYYMENVKKKSAATIDYISSETMKKTGDQNVSAAIARVSGVSTGGSGLITVRGIGDRYVKTTLNGSRIPTLDPLTNNIKLDLFPSSMVDNVIITKTQSPDLPGDWAGAYISIETKDYPDKFLLDVESQVGFNQQTTFQDYITSDRSATDWLGFDTGLRERNHSNFYSPSLLPSTYEEMVALGLKDYYSSMGITGWVDGTAEGETYFKLGLVQLGLLGAASINDPIAFNNAKLEYTAGLKKDAFSVLIPEGSDFNDGFATNWETYYRKAPLNFSQKFTVGDQLNLFKKPFGYLFGFRYGSFVRYDPNGVSARVRPDPNLEYVAEAFDDALISRQSNGWNAMINLSYKPNDKNTFGFLFMPNLVGNNDVTNFISADDGTEIQEGRTSKNQFYEQRKQFIYQLKSEHFIAGPKLKLDFNASYTDGNSSAPDFKVVSINFERDNKDGSLRNILFGPTVGSGVRRYFRYLNEDLFDGRVSAEMPIGKQIGGGIRKIRFGGAYQFSNREQDLFDYYVALGNSTSPLISQYSLDPNVHLDPSHFIVSDKEVDYTYELLDPAVNHTFGKSKIWAGFIMTDYSITSYFRASGGIRIESATFITDAVYYDAEQYPVNDPRRINPGGFPLMNPVNFTDVSFLPSINLIFKLKETWNPQMNIRLNYSKSTARPSLRELNEAAVFDNEYRTIIFGNSELLPAKIDNYDFRFESYFNNGDHLSASVFYKDFINHIEMTFQSSGISWNNVGRSYARGIELEGLKTLGKHFDFRANITLVSSNSNVIRKVMQVKDGIRVYTPVDTTNRPMFGQAPYIVNCILGYKADSIGLLLTLSYNLQGPRLAITGIVPGWPDVYEMPRHVLDFKISKKLGKHFYTSFVIRDILNAPVRRTYDLPEGFQYDFDSFRYGTNYQFSLGYKI